MLKNPEQFHPNYKERMRKQKEIWDMYINKNGERTISLLLDVANNPFLRMGR